MERKRIDVAAGVLFDPNGQFLLGQRAENTVYPGYWEFPGGKIEKGETPAQALCRELKEELGITVVRLRPWLMRKHDYEHAQVSLHFFEVAEWEGRPEPLVHSRLAWAGNEVAPDFTPMLPANGPILKALKLPRFMGITYASEIGIEAQLQAIDYGLANGLRLVQVREPGLSLNACCAFIRQVIQRVHKMKGLVIVNGDVTLARETGADGIHLPARQLMEVHQRPDFAWVGASCHQDAELHKAIGLGLDYAVLGPVEPTLSHPERVPIGWKGFAESVVETSIPVFALGGVQCVDLEYARDRGAHGVAAIRSAWCSSFKLL